MVPVLQEQVNHLMEMLRKYELAAEGANDGLWDWNLETNEVFVSGPWLGMLGYQDGELEEDILLWEKLLHPEDLERAITTFYGYLQGEQPVYEMEFRMRHKNGSYRWIHSKGRVIRDAQQKPLRVSGSHTDITDRKLAQEALIQNEQKYKNLFENSLVGMFRAEMRSGIILEANGKAWEMFGVSPQKGTNIKDFFINDVEREVALRNLLRNGVIENHELEVQRSNGERIWVLMSATYYPIESLLECVLKDITETKQNLLELQKVNFELDNFVYHASHDLRSPLRSILGLVNILRTESSERSRQNMTDMIEGSIKRLDNLVQDLLAMSRNNRVNDPHQPVNFMNEIHYSCTNCYHVADTGNLQVRLRIHQPVAFVSDLTRIRIILNNLISNAIKYRRFTDEPSYVYIQVEVNEQEAVVIIEDNGEGIPKDRQAVIFDMFVRSSEKSEGSGLGLYIVKNVIEKLNGAIDVVSEEGQGSKFSVHLPNHASQES